MHRFSFRPWLGSFVSLTACAVLAFASDAARAAGPARPVSAEEATLPTCFGYVGSGDAVYAVRLKSSCEAATGKCEVASYLARVTPDGLTKTVAYLTYWKGDGMPSPSQVAATAKPANLEKALAEMGDATMACDAVQPGKRFSYDEGRRSGSLEKLSDGTWVVRSDNLRSQVLPPGIDALFVAPRGGAWFVHRTTTDGAAADATFERISVDLLMRPAPRAAAPKAVAVASHNVATEACLGWQSGDDTMVYLSPEVASGQAYSRLYTVRAASATMTEVAKRPLLPGLSSPQVALATVVPSELALANDLLAEVDTGCLATPLAAGKTATIPARGTTVEVTRQGSEVMLLGPDGARVSVSIGGGGASEVTLVRADGKDARWYLAAKDGGRLRFVPIALDPVFVKPTLFALPATVGAPVCVETAYGEMYILMYTRTPGAAGDEAVLTLESLGARPSVVPLAKATLAATDPDDAILAKIARDRRIEVAAKLGDTKACALTALGADAAFTADGVGYTLKQDGGRWAVARADHAALLPLASARGTPRWAMGTTLFFATESGHGWTRTTFDPRGWDRLPDPPEAAAKAPKLLDGKVPGHVPAQRRCLAWNSKDRAVWIVRMAGDCTTADGSPCTPSTILTEVRKEASYKRVTLAKNGASTPAAHAGRAGPGRHAGRQGGPGVRGRHGRDGPRGAGQGVARGRSGDGRGERQEAACRLDHRSARRRQRPHRGARERVLAPGRERARAGDPAGQRELARPTLCVGRSGALRDQADEVRLAVSGPPPMCFSLGTRSRVEGTAQRGAWSCGVSECSWRSWSGSAPAARRTERLNRRPMWR